MVRSFFRVSRAAVLWALPALLTIPPARAQSYTITDLGTLGGASSQAHGVNGSGEIVGQALTASGDDHAFRYSAGVMSDLNVRGSISVARAINASGQIAGYYYSKSYQAFLLTNGKLQDLGNLGGNYSAAYGVSVLGHVCGSSYTRKNQEHAFLWKGGKMIDLGTLGGNYSSARGINKSDQVVGYAYLASGAFHAFLGSGGLMTDLGTLGGDLSQADAINDAGQVVGQAYLPGNVKAHAFLDETGPLKDLGDLSGDYSEALALNSTGSQIVGKASVPNSSGFIVYHAFLWSGGSMMDLNSLIPSDSGWVLSEATGINDGGQIVGTGTVDGQQQGFLLNPK